MEGTKKIARMIAIMLVAGLGISACDQADEIFANELVPIVSLGDDGGTNIEIEVLKSVSALGEGELTEAQVHWLEFMREEEKLAGDVYRTFYELFNIPIFNNISKSEDNHTSVVLTYLEAWDISDPASGEVGVFNNEELQSLYNDLIEKGKYDMTEALKVGALIEEVDIADLVEIYDIEPTEDLILLAEALMLGSRNHLRSFTRILDRRGVEYQPVILSMEEYQAIVTSAWEKGTGLCRKMATTDAE